MIIRNLAPCAGDSAFCFCIVSVFRCFFSWCDFNYRSIFDTSYEYKINNNLPSFEENIIPDYNAISVCVRCIQEVIAVCHG